MIECECPVQYKAPKKIIYSGLVLHEEKPFACKEAYAKHWQWGLCSGAAAEPEHSRMLCCLLQALPAPPLAPTESSSAVLPRARNLSFPGEKQELFTLWAHLKPVPTCSHMGRSELSERG